MAEDEAEQLKMENSNLATSREASKQPLLAQTKPDQFSKSFVYILTVSAAMGGLLFGYDTGVISGALILLRKQFRLSFFMQELVVSITIFAAIFGVLLSGPISHYMGRRIALIISSVVFAIGAVCMAVAENIELLLVGRTVVGIAIGLSSMAVPIYIAEATPASMRGQLVSVNQIFIAAGQFIASLLDGIFYYDKENGWRYMLGLSGVPAVVMFVGLLFMPESPRWLVATGQLDKAREALKKIHNVSNVDERIADISKANEQQQLEHSSGGNIFKHVWENPSVRMAVFVGCGLQFFQQFSGINTVMYYGATIIKMAGAKSDEAAIWLAVPVAFTNFIFSFVALFVVERIGRRKLILISLTGVICSLLLLSIVFLFETKLSPDITIHPSNISDYGCTMDYSKCYLCIQNQHCGFCYLDSNGDVENASCLPVLSSYDTDHSLHGQCNTTANFSWNYHHCPFVWSWLAVLGLIVYLAWFASGMGPMPWTINSEIYPQWARSFGNTASAATNWTCNFLVAMTFLHLTKWLTKSGAFGLYAGISVLGWLFIYNFVPETKGKTLEEVTTLFDNGAHQYSAVE